MMRGGDVSRPGLAPLKMLSFENGVNLTLGLPIRTSPDHGTAFDHRPRPRQSASTRGAGLGRTADHPPNPWA